MQQEYNVVIADTTCFILLYKIDMLNLLHQVFGEIITTKTIALEFGKPLPTWVSTKEIIDVHYQNILELEVDKGEASAIALSLEYEKSLLILDDFKARKLAQKLSLNFTGTLGIFIKAKQLGIVRNIKPVLEKIQNTNFRFSKEVFENILQLADEN